MQPAALTAAAQYTVYCWQHLSLAKGQQDADHPFHSLKLAKQIAAAFPNCTNLEFAWSSSSMVNVHRSISQLLAG
jgi:hypothetical protein